MDFVKVLSVAQQNKSTVSSENFYKTKFEPPKKEQKEKKRLSANIQKFLAKKEEEERERERLNKKRRDELIAKRDPKMQRKIEKMLKVTKSANKSVLQDAVNHHDTAVTLEGPDQPDEDDYGYTSQVASDYYKSLMAKYNKAPDEKKTSSKSPSKYKLSKEEILSTKNRVRAAINKEREDAAGPHTRKPRQNQSSSNSSVSGSYEKGDAYNAAAEKALAEKEKKAEQRARLKNRPPPPVMDFQALLKMAEQKQHEPVKIEVASKKKEDGRLLSKKERKEQEEREAYFREKDIRARMRDAPKSNGKIPKVGDKNKPVDSSGGSKLFAQLTKPQDSSKKSTSKVKINPTVPLNRPSTTLPTPKVVSKPSSTQSTQRPQPGPSKIVKPSAPVQTYQQNQRKPEKSKQELPKVRQFPPKDVQRSRPFPPKDVQRSREFPPRDVQRSREFPPKDVQRSREFPPKDLQRRGEPIRNGRKPLSNLKHKRVIEDDDDSEYDSEMDDFIDDGDADQDYSSHIKAIFGYDKSRYRDEDYDDEDQMESNYATCMREEFISKKIGIMEDLEDMKAEEEEMKKKAARNKKRRRID